MNSNVIPFPVKGRDSPQAETCFFHIIETDSMNPTFRSGEVLLLAPADRWMGDGVYLMDFGDGFEALLRMTCDPAGNRIAVTRDNPAIRKRDQFLTSKQFRRGVTGKVVAHLRTFEEGIHHAIRQAVRTSLARAET